METDAIKQAELARTGNHPGRDPFLKQVTERAVEVARDLVRQGASVGVDANAVAEAWGEALRRVGAKI